MQGLPNQFLLQTVIPNLASHCNCTTIYAILLKIEGHWSSDDSHSSKKTHRQKNVVTGFHLHLVCLLAVPLLYTLCHWKGWHGRFLVSGCIENACQERLLENVSEKPFFFKYMKERQTGWFDEIQRTAKVPVSKCNAWCSRRRPSVAAHPVLAPSHWCWRQLPEVQQPACSKQSVASPHHCRGESHDMHHNCCKSSHSPPNLAVTPVKEVSQQFWNEFSLCSVGVFWFKMQSACQVQWNLSLKAP